MTGAAGAAQRVGGDQVARVISRAREQAGLSTSELAEVVGIGPRQIQNWAAGKGTPANAQRLRQLLDLQYVLDLMKEVYDADGCMLWLHARNRSLGGKRPLDLMAAGQTDDVIEYLDRLADGNF